jgi:type VI protein secretion system component VasA
MTRALFEREVDYLWSRLARAAGEREELASLWSRDSDPRMTRLVQSAAYAFARVTEKLEDDLPEISHALVASALPEALRATPSATVVQVRDGRRSWKSAQELPAGTSLPSRTIDGVPCLFRTAWLVIAAPLDLTRAEIRPRESGMQVLTLRLEAYLGRPIELPETLRLFLETTDPAHALDVAHALVTTRAPVRLRALDARGHELSARQVSEPRITWTALEDPLSLVPGPTDRFASGTALRALSTFPEVFAFVDVHGVRAAAGDLPSATRAIEIQVGLEGTVSEKAMAAQVHLGCAPAVNVFEAATVPQPIRSLGPCGTLALPESAERELFHLESVGLVPNDAPDAIIPVRLWESYRGQPCLDDELYLRLTRRAQLGRGPVELRGTLVRPSARSANGTRATRVPQGFLQIRGLATDGCRTDTLLRGDLRSTNDNLQVTNLTRVTAPRPVRLEARFPWRANAYARMPVSRFALAASLAGYLDLHDATAARADALPGASPSLAGIVSAERRPVKRVEGDEVFLGDEVHLMLDSSVFGGPGATWLVGELLARALAERCDFLRYTRVRTVTPDGSGVTDYGVRPGDRLPPPFG